MPAYVLACLLAHVRACLPAHVRACLLAHRAEAHLDLASRLQQCAPLRAEATRLEAQVATLETEDRAAATAATGAGGAVVALEVALKVLTQGVAEVAAEGAARGDAAPGTGAPHTGHSNCQSRTRLDLEDSLLEGAR